MKIMSCPVGRSLAPCRPHKSCYLGTLHTWRNYCAWSVVTSLTICRSQNKFENKFIWLHFNFQLSNISKILHIPRQENVRAIMCSCVNVLPNLSRQNEIQWKHRLLYQLLYPFSRNKYWPLECSATERSVHGVMDTSFFSNGGNLVADSFNHTCRRDNYSIAMVKYSKRVSCHIMAWIQATVHWHDSHWYLSISQYPSGWCYKKISADTCVDVFFVLRMSYAMSDN